VIRLAADENFDRAIADGLRHLHADLDMVSAQQAGLAGADDPTILTWAANEGRILLSHDRQTMIGFAYDRLRAGLPLPGLCIVDTRLSIGDAIADIELLLAVYADEEWQNRVLFVPV
jgi:hypothetical protein